MPETDKSIVIAEIDEIKWQSDTGQSVLKSKGKGLYRTGSHFTGLVRRHFVFTGTTNFVQTNLKYSILCCLYDSGIYNGCHYIVKQTTHKSCLYGLYIFTVLQTLDSPVLGMLSLYCNFTWILWWYLKCGLSSVLEFCILQIPPLCSQHS